MSKKGEITLRRPQVEDIPALTELVNQPQVQANTSRMPYTPEAWVRARVEGSGAHVHPLVALVDDRAVGWATIVRRSGRQAHVGELGISVHDAFAGQGIGRRLMEGLIDLADNWLGLTRLFLYVYEGNAPAVALYKSLGFEVEGTLRGDVLQAGVLLDSYAMARLRDPVRRQP